jgi:hypothetical protein
VKRVGFARWNVYLLDEAGGHAAPDAVLARVEQRAGDSQLTAVGSQCSVGPAGGALRSAAHQHAPRSNAQRAGSHLSRFKQVKPAIPPPMTATVGLSGSASSTCFCGACCLWVVGEQGGRGRGQVSGKWETVIGQYRA